MAVYRKVQVDFWDDPQMLDFTPEDKLFYMYLLTNPHTTQCGIYELPYQKMVLHLGYNRESCVNLIKRFEQYGKIRYNEPTKEIFLVNWVKHNWNNSPKVIRFIEKELNDVKFRPFVEAFLSICSERGYKLYANSSDTVSGQYANSSDTVSGQYANSSDTVGNDDQNDSEFVDFVDNSEKYSTDTVSVLYRQEKEKKEEEEEKEKELKNTTTPTTMADALKIWDACLKQLEIKITKPSFETWFKNTRALSYENKKLVVEMPNEFAQDWVESRYSVFVKNILRELSEGQAIEVKFVLAKLTERPA